MDEHTSTKFEKISSAKSFSCDDERNKNTDHLNNNSAYNDRMLYEQTIDFRDYLKARAFIILYLELGFLGVLILLQGFGHYYHWFYLNDWVIGAFSGGCLFQTFLIIRYIAVNIFPNNNHHKSKHGDTHVHHHHHTK